MYFFVIHKNKNPLLNIASGTIELLSLVSNYCTQRETKLQDIMYRNMSLNLNGPGNILCVKINLKYEKNKNLLQLGRIKAYNMLHFTTHIYLLKIVYFYFLRTKLLLLCIHQI